MKKDFFIKSALKQPQGDSANQHALKQTNAGSANIDGFTLVELAISLMVIGLLLGGVLKGQELIENARVTSTLQQVKMYQTALASFRSSYRAIPGDIISPSTRLPNCSTAPCNTNGNGNTFVEPLDATSDTLTASISGSTTAFAAAGEARNFWLHLSKAGLISGVDPNGASSAPFQFGVEVPKSKFANTGFYASSIIFRPDSPNLYSSNFAGNVIRIASTDNATRLNASQAAQLDRKIDDGKPHGGEVFTSYGGCATASDVNAAYDEVNETNLCEVYFTMGL